MVTYVNQSDLVQLGYPFTSADTAAVTQMCQTATSMIESRTLRKFAYGTATERHRSYMRSGTLKIFTNNYPVVSVTNASMYWVNYPASVSDITASAFINNEDAYLELSTGGLSTQFPYYNSNINSTGKMVVSVTYTYGWLETETHTVPAVAPYTVTVDEAATWVSSVSITGATPTSVTEGVYTFASAAAGTTVEISYSTIPADLIQAGVLIVQGMADNYFKAKLTGFAGVSSMMDGNRRISFGGSGASGSAKTSHYQAAGAVSDAAMDILAQYRRVR